MPDETSGPPKNFKLTKRSVEDMREYLFNRMFIQTAHISILDEALDTIRRDLIIIGTEFHIDVSNELAKIDIAYQSIQKLKDNTK